MLYEVYDDSLRPLSEDEVEALRDVLIRTYKQFDERSGRVEHYIEGELVFVWIDEEGGK